MPLRDAAVTLGPHRLSPAAFLAPMASVSNPPFRAVCLRLGAGLATTEMVPAVRLARGRDRGPRPFERADGESVLHVQIFGHEPGILAEAAVRAEALGADAIDLNLGCPARKVVHSGSGAALGRDPIAGARALGAMARAVRIPVTAKIRSGWDAAGVNAVEAARRLEDAGAAMIAVHGRTREQQFGGKADWSVIRAVVEAVRIPVVGNGDVRSADDAERMVRETGCAAVMVGRGAMGRPWIFRALASGADGEPDPAERAAIFREFLDRYVRWAGADRASREMRKHLLWLVRGAPGAAAFRARAGSAGSPAGIEGLLDDAVGIMAGGRR